MAKKKTIRREFRFEITYFSPRGFAAMCVRVCWEVRGETWSSLCGKQAKKGKK